MRGAGSAGHRAPCSPLTLGAGSGSLRFLEPQACPFWFEGVRAGAVNPLRLLPEEQSNRCHSFKTHWRPLALGLRCVRSKSAAQRVHQEHTRGSWAPGADGEAPGRIRRLCSPMAMAEEPSPCCSIHSLSGKEHVVKSSRSRPRLITPEGTPRDLCSCFHYQPPP